MAMTAQVKSELANTQITKTCCRKAEVASMLRFAGGLHIVNGKIVVEAELDTGAAARRLRTDVQEVYGHESDVVMVQGNGIRKGSRYIVRISKQGEALARQTGLLDQRGRPVRGLPPAVVSGGGCDAVAAWRGAFLAHGSLTEPGRSSSLEVTCPGPEAALALVDAISESGQLDGYYLVDATRADLLRRLGREPESTASYRAALELAPTDAERRFLRSRFS